MRAKAPKIIYAASFIPLMWCIVISIVSAGMGGSFLTDFCFSVIYFTAAIPVLPVCIIVQIVCILIIKKMRAEPLKKYVLITVAVTVGICGGSALIIFGDTLVFNIEKYFEKRSAIHMLKNAEEKKNYNEGTYYFGGVLNIDELIHDIMLIDYDKNEVGFVYECGAGGFWKVKLEPANDNSYNLRRIREEYFVQADVPLSAPGKRLITFCEDETTRHRTIAMIMETEDGSLFADDIREKDTGYAKFNGFNWSDYYVGEGVRYADL